MPSAHRRGKISDCLMRRYYDEKGFAVILVSRILNVLALGFTIIFSAFLLLFVRWSALESDCIQNDTCDISKVRLYQPTLALDKNPSFIKCASQS